MKLQALTSDWSQTTQTNDNGEFSFATVPVGDYKITVSAGEIRRPRSRPSRSLQLLAGTSLSTGDRDR